MKASNYKWLTALLLIQARVSVSFPYSTPSTVVQNAQTRLTDQRTTSCLTRRRHILAYWRSNRSFKTTHVICNGSSPSSRTAAIDSYKSLPVVDDGLGPLDFSITDSLSVPDHVRPTLVESVSNPREILAITLLVFGGCSVAYHNIFGIYGPSYEMAQQVSIGLGFSNAFAVIFQLQTSFLISKRVRMGIMDDATLNKCLRGLLLIFCKLACFKNIHILSWANIFWWIVALGCCSNICILIGWSSNYALWAFQ